MPGLFFCTARLRRRTEKSAEMIDGSGEPPIEPCLRSQSWKPRKPPAIETFFDRNRNVA